MSVRALLIATVSGLAVGLAAGGAVQGWRMGEQIAALRADYADKSAKQADAYAEDLEAQQRARLKLERALHDLDTTKHQELTDANKRAADLATELLTAQRRLSIRTTSTICPGALPTASAATGLDAEEGRAELHPEDAAAIAAITAEADACAIALDALQEWAGAVTRDRAQ